MSLNSHDKTRCTFAVCIGFKEECRVLLIESILTLLPAGVTKYMKVGVFVVCSVERDYYLWHWSVEGDLGYRGYKFTKLLQI